MKKIALLLAIAIILTMTGCASEDSKAMDAANALLEAGDYAGAIEAYGAISSYQDVSAQIAAAADGLIKAGEYEKAMELLSSVNGYQVIADKMAEAEKLLQEQNAGFLYGTWKNLYSDAVLTMHEDGTGVLTTEDNTYDIRYTYEDGILTLDNPVTFVLTVSEENGICHLINDVNSMNFVTEADYEEVGPREVEITMENWEQYFELKHVRSLLYDQFGEPTAAAFNYAIYLKEEYVEKLAGGDQGLHDLVFKLEFDQTHRYVTNVTSDDYVVGDIQFSNESQTNTATIHDYRGNSSMSTRGVLAESVCGEFSLGWVNIDQGSEESDTYPYMENGKIIAVQGSVMLFP